MLKTILLVLAVVFAYWYFVGRPRATGKPRRDTVVAEDMVVCAHCGLRVPESDAIPADGRTYCCDEHRRLGAP